MSWKGGRTIKYQKGRRNAVRALKKALMCPPRGKKNSSAPSQDSLKLLLGQGGETVGGTRTKKVLSAQEKRAVLGRLVRGLRPPSRFRKKKKDWKKDKEKAIRLAIQKKRAGRGEIQLIKPIWTLNT